MRLAALAPDISAALTQLQNAAVHFDDALAAVQHAPSNTAAVRPWPCRLCGRLPCCGWLPAMLQMALAQAPYFQGLTLLSSCGLFICASSSVRTALRKLW